MERDNSNLEAAKKKSEIKIRLLCWQFLSDPLQRCDSGDSCGSCHPHFKLSVLQIKFPHEKAKYQAEIELRKSGGGERDEKAKYQICEKEERALMSS